MGMLNCKMFSSGPGAQTTGVTDAADTMDAKDGATGTDEFVEGVVCRTTDLQDGDMKVFDLRDAGKVLLVRQGGRLSALGTKCTHYGAPLVGGALGDGRVRCQWHGACFSVATGDIEDFPGLDSLPCYQVKECGDEVRVRARRSDLQAGRRTLPLTRRDPDDARTIVVVGGGPSGACCVETLRQQGYAGRLVLVCGEPCLPYDRVKLSKDPGAALSALELRTRAFYEAADVELLVGVRAASVDAATSRVLLEDGASLPFHRLYVATGCEPRRPDVPGAELRGVLVLREHAHAAQLHAALRPDAHVVLLGASFIAVEAAAYCAGKAASVTVVGRSALPLGALLGERVARRLQRLLEERGVRFMMRSGVRQLLGREGALVAVQLLDGTELPADLCVLGLGGEPRTQLLHGTATLNADGTVPVDGFLETSAPGVFAGGDIAHAPVLAADGQPAAIGHFGLAHYHGRVAALNMLGRRTELRAVPYFWTMLCGKSLRYAGHGAHDSVLIDGDVDELKFVAFYLSGDRVVAVASCQRDPVVSQFAELTAQGRRLHRADLEPDPLAWTRAPIATPCT